MKIAALILAAGRGQRMNAGMNKQMMLLEGKPLLVHTLQNWHEIDEVQDIYIVVSPQEQTRVESMLAEHQIQKVKGLVHGGNERQDSVYAGLMCMQNDPPDLVLIHDGARPFTDPASIRALLRVVQAEGAAILALPVKETMKVVDDKHQIQTTPDRTRLWAAQTPQGFDYTLICEAHRQARAEQFLGTDDASLVERTGHRVYVVESTEENIKLTTPDDLLLAKLILERSRSV